MNERKRFSRRIGPRRHCFLVEEWHKAHTWLSVQISFLAGVIDALYQFVPGAKEYLPETVFHYLMMFLAFAAIAGRVYQQKTKP